MTSRMGAESPWYELFSRGARDWLRHNQKIRDAVRANLPDMVAKAGLSPGAQDRTVQVPVRLLEHARFRLADPAQRDGTGQGRGAPGEVLRKARSSGSDSGGAGGGGNEQGEMRFVLEMKLDEILDWLWEELKLPELKPRVLPTLDEGELVREGWDRRGVRSRLDRRRTMKEAIKRSAMQNVPLALQDSDLRFRQLAHRARPATSAAVIFALDVSGSMGEKQRQLAKNFFFFALQGIRRQYRKVEIAFVAHTVEAWELTETEFFQASASGGTVASSAFERTLEIIHARFDPARYNVYLFYASDGENFAEDRHAALARLGELGRLVNFAGYVEVTAQAPGAGQTELKRIFASLEAEHQPVGSATLSRYEDIWTALRRFFTVAAETGA